MKRAVKPIALIGSLTAGLAGLALLFTLSATPIIGALPALTPTLSPTPTPTPTRVFSATLSIDAQPVELDIGETLTLTVDLKVSEGCVYPVLELRVSQAGDEPPIFEHIVPPTDVLSPGVSFPSVWTFRATQSGPATFKADTFGERYCGDYWNWHYANATSEEVHVLPPPTITPSPTPTHTPTPTLTPTPTATPVFSAALLLAAEPPILHAGETLTVTVDLDVAEGCQYPIFELTLNQPGDETPIFEHIQPPTGIITGPITLPSVWTFRATQPGTATFAARTFGEKNCGMEWIWHYENGVSEPVSVIPWLYQTYFPTIRN